MSSIARNLLKASAQIRSNSPLRHLCSQNSITPFKLGVEVQHFQPDEISVEVSDQYEITVEGKHLEEHYGKTYVARHFIGRYIIPKNINLDQLEAKMSASGKLTITAPKVVTVSQLPFLTPGTKVYLGTKKPEPPEPEPERYQVK